MTIPEFVQEVAALGLEWSDDGTVIRCMDGDCPIFALAKAKGLAAPGENNWHAQQIGQRLGLTLEDAALIIDAADYRSFKTSNQVRGLLMDALFKTSGKA